MPMRIEDLYIGFSAIFVVLYFFGMRTAKTSSLTINFYDSYYVLNISFISLLLLLVAVVDAVVYKILRLSMGGELSSAMSIVQFICTICFFALMMALTFSGTFIRTSSLLAIVVSFLISQLLLIGVYFSSAKAV